MTAAAGLPAIPTHEVIDWQRILRECIAAGRVAYPFTLKEANTLRVALYRDGWNATMRRIDGGYSLTITGSREKQKPLANNPVIA